METGPRLKVLSDRLVKPGIEPATPGLQGKQFIHYTIAASVIITCSCLYLFSTKLVKRGGLFISMSTPTKQSNAQHLVEYQKQLLQEENQQSGNVMQQLMLSHLCGINLRSESYLVLSDLLFA